MKILNDKNSSTCFPMHDIYGTTNLTVYVYNTCEL
jgi:hypothetical protein